MLYMVSGVLVAVSYLVALVWVFGVFRWAVSGFSAARLRLVMLVVTSAAAVLAGISGMFADLGDPTLAAVVLLFSVVVPPAVLALMVRPTVPAPASFLALSALDAVFDQATRQGLSVLVQTGSPAFPSPASSAVDPVSGEFACLYPSGEVFSFRVRGVAAARQPAQFSAHVPLTAWLPYDLPSFDPGVSPSRILGLYLSPTGRVDFVGLARTWLFRQTGFWSVLLLGRTSTPYDGFVTSDSQVRVTRLPSGVRVDAGPVWVCARLMLRSPSQVLLRS